MCLSHVPYYQYRECTASDNMLDVVIVPVRLSLDIDHYNSVTDMPLEARSVAKDSECLI